MFLTTVESLTGNVVASFSSKMFKLVEGKRQSFAIILFKKLGFVVGTKSLMKRVYDLQIIFHKRVKMNRLRAILKGLHKSGLKFRHFFTKRRIAHNGCRGNAKRRI